MFLTAISFLLMKWYAVEVAHLIKPDGEADILRHSFLRIVVGPALYLIAFLFALVNTQIAIVIYIVIPIIYFFPVKLEKDSSENE